MLNTRYIRISKIDGNRCEINFETLLAKTEGAGYWKKGTVKEMLEEGLEVQTPYAVYKKEIVSLTDFIYAPDSVCRPREERQTVPGVVYIVMESMYDETRIVEVFRNEEDAKVKRNICQDEANVCCGELNCDVPIYKVEPFAVL